MREGARAEIERIIGTNANDRVALQLLIKGEGDWNRDRLATLFGKDRADRVISLLDRERAFADTSQLVTRNSESLARREAINDVSGQAGGDFGVVDSFKAGGVGGATRAAGIKGVEKVIDALKGVKSEAARKQMAETLTGNNQAVVDALLRSAKGAALDTSQIDLVSRALLLTSVGGVGRWPVFANGKINEQANETATNKHAVDEVPAHGIEEFVEGHIAHHIVRTIARPDVRIANWLIARTLATGLCFSRKPNNWLRRRRREWWSGANLLRLAASS